MAWACAEPYGVLVLGDATRGGVGVQYDPERQVLSVVSHLTHKTM